MRADAVALLAGALVLAAPAAFADGAPRVLDAAGGEILSGSRWTAVAKGATLKKGDSVRTSDAGWLLVGLDDALDSVAWLGPGSRLALRGSEGGPVYLEKGRVFVLREPRPRHDVFLIATPDARVYLETGGVAAEIAGQGTTVKVYGDRVRVATGAKSALVDVAEGFQFRSRPAPAMRRMSYEDYADWLAWTKRWYEAKDRLDRNRLQKEYAL